jgi:hypothetical protein
MMRMPSSRSGAIRLPIFVVERWRLSPVDAELDDRNVRWGVQVAQHRPRAVVEPPALIKPHGQRGKQPLHTPGKLRVAGRWILHLIQFPREPAEVVDRPRGGAHGQGSISMYQCADTQRMAFGRGRPAPIATHRSVKGFRSRAFIGFPCPKKTAGIRCAMSRTSKPTRPKRCRATPL